MNILTVLLSKQYRTIFLFMISLAALLAACQNNNQQQEIIVAPTLQATQTIEIAAATTPTATPIPTQATMTPTVTVAPTVTTTPLPTTTPTVPPLPPDDNYFSALMADEYAMVSTARFNTSTNAYYIGYMLQDTSLDPGLNEVSPEICRAIFYRWGINNASSEPSEGRFVATFPAQSAAKADGFFPVTCDFINWEHPRGFDYLSINNINPNHGKNKQTETLGINGNLSDINANGLPEIAILSYYCANACINWGYVSAHFYEIQNDGSIVPITNNLPGEIVPFFDLSFKEEAGTLLVYKLNTLSKWERAESWWVYKWDGVSYQNATLEYQEGILQWAQNRLELICNLYGEPIEWTRMDFIEILLQLEKAGLQQEAIEIIQEITDPIHWPETDFHHQCWLRVLRDNAIEEYEASQPFSLPESTLFFGEHSPSGSYPDNCTDIDR
jgi:hypothetical protein